jgi:PAS domain S-box-containing protein
VVDARTDRSLQAELEEAYALLDVIFARAPVGLALFDAELRYARVNERMAAMNGMPASAHVGRPLREVLPGLPLDVEDDLRRVLHTGEPLIEVEVSGETPARPGRRREWLSSYWPVRPRGDTEVTGIGAVVFEVTDRRTARRALRSQADRYEALLQALSEAGQGMVVLEEDGRCAYANAAFEQITGYTFPELTAMDSLFELAVPGDRAEAARRAVLRIERGWIDTSYTLALRRRDEAIVEVEVAGVPLDSDDGRQLVVLVRDVTERRRIEAEREQLLTRAALMAEASELFDQSLDETRTLESVARLCVRELADTCVLVLGDTPRTVRRVVAAAREPDREQALLEMQLRYPIDDDPAHPVLEALLTGRSRIVPSLPPERFEEVARDDRELELLLALGIGAAVIVPLRARGAVCGAMAVGLDSLAGEDADFLLAVLEDLGRRAALALDTARLYEERDSIARTLQRSLLPPALPAIRGIDLAARYLAAGHGNEVGGDFYDCFATAPGEWAVVIGDVCGKGAEAAAVTALARYTIRTSVLHDRRPAAVLRELNEAILSQHADFRFCTAVHVALRPTDDGGADACVAVGGHPLPLLVHADGRVVPAGRAGTLLGVLADPEVHEEDVHLDPGDALVLYTDGVIEASPLDDALGPERLSDVLRGCAGQDAATIATSVETRTLEVQHGRLRDDVAVVVVRAAPGAAEPFVPAERGVATRS